MQFLPNFIVFVIGQTVTLLNTLHAESANCMQRRSCQQYTACSTTGKPTRSFATERVSLDSV
jgi:hypothetical protein